MLLTGYVNIRSKQNLLNQKSVHPQRLLELRSASLMKGGADMAKPEESVELLFAKKIGSQTDEGNELTYSSKDKTLHQWADNHWKPIQLDELENMAWMEMAD